MPKTAHSVASRARRKRILKEAKGYFGRRKNVWTVAKNAVEKGLAYAYEGRKQKKRQFKRLWIQRIKRRGSTSRPILLGLHVPAQRSQDRAQQKKLISPRYRKTRGLC